MIPFVDLKAQYRAIKYEIDPAVLDVFAGAEFVLGPAVQAFERDFGEQCGARHVIGVNSGTSALHLALLAAGVGPGDEVITTPLTFVATAAAIDYCGARPVFVDVDPVTLNIDPNRMEAAITARTKAILPVHLHGLPADMGPILGIADRHGVTVVEDAAQAHSARWQDRPVGTLGRVGCFSFYPGKNLGAYGEAGAVVTADDAVAHTVRMLRDWGAERRYEHNLKGFNFRMEGVQGAVLGVKLRHLEDWTESRRAHAARYDELLGTTDLVLPARPADRRHVYHVYAVRTPHRTELQEHLTAQGIGTGIHYPIPIHLQRCFAELGHTRGDFPEAERAADELLSLPMYPELPDDHIDWVASSIAGWIAERAGGVT
ncbi:MAG: DegT/DnrJ/EryC1/StrS family aminotransferase [Ilumatobacteraceae bacterium]